MEILRDWLGLEEEKLKELKDKGVIQQNRSHTKVQDYGAMLNTYRGSNYTAGCYNISDYMDEPDLQFIWSLSSDKSSSNFGRYKDPILDDLYQRQNRTIDPVERRKLCK